jgi:hypothetical protein
MTMTAESIQLSFRQQFVPVPQEKRHYVAAVQNKPGELDALRPRDA